MQFIKSIRMQWAEDAWRADGCLIKEVMTWTLEGRKPKGRPRKR
jgi:hypothetical protein